jgi:hypothetical protein
MTVTLLWKCNELIVTQQELLRYYSNATKDLTCHNIHKRSHVCTVLIRFFFSHRVLRLVWSLLSLTSHHTNPARYAPCFDHVRVWEVPPHRTALTQLGTLMCAQERVVSCGFHSSWRLPFAFNFANSIWFRVSAVSDLCTNGTDRWLQQTDSLICRITSRNTSRQCLYMLCVFSELRGKFRVWHVLTEVAASLTLHFPGLARASVSRML